MRVNQKYAPDVRECGGQAATFRNNVGIRTSCLSRTYRALTPDSCGIGVENLKNDSDIMFLGPATMIYGVAYITLTPFIIVVGPKKKTEHSKHSENEEHTAHAEHTEHTERAHITHITHIT